MATSKIPNNNNPVFTVYNPSNMDTNPFDEGNSGMILSINANGETKGYLVIRPKHYADPNDSSKYIAMEVYNANWQRTIKIHADN